METSLKISNISKAYPDCLANDNINLELKSGKIYALLGENGAGKSTLVKILFGIIQPDKGKIFLNNQILKLNSPRDAKKNKISMVFQHFSLFETLSVFENLILDSEEHRKSLENKIQNIINKYNFNIDLNRVYACGMSNGGYMSYRLACDLSSKIAAFGSVTGNFMINTEENDCLDQDREIPMIHFHGTADEVVNYFPPSFDESLTVGESIDFWSDYNNLTTEAVDSINTNVEIYTYSNESSITKFIHYKVYGGNHEWFGSTWANNWGFNTSEELVNYFLQYQLNNHQDTN